MRRFVKIKHSRIGDITLSFTDMGKSCTVRDLFTSQVYLLTLFTTLENLCTRKAQSSRGVRSRRVHKIYYFGLL